MGTLYRNYDRAELDVQYNARATVPDIQPILKKYAEDSATARRTLDCALDVPFGEHADELLDIFPAANTLPGTAGAPVFVFIHGGYWRLLSKNESSGMAPAFTQAGAVVVSVNYSLAPAVTLDRIVDQNRRALAWIHRNIARFGGDPARIHVCGSSAGGHLAGALLAGGWHASYEVPPDVIRGAAPLSGLFDEWSASRSAPIRHVTIIFVTCANLAQRCLTAVADCRNCARAQGNLPGSFMLNRIQVDDCGFIHEPVAANAREQAISCCSDCRCRPEWTASSPRSKHACFAPAASSPLRCTRGRSGRSRCR